MTTTFYIDERSGSALGCDPWLSSQEIPCISLRYEFTLSGRFTAQLEIQLHNALKVKKTGKVVYCTYDDISRILRLSENSWSNDCPFFYCYFSCFKYNSFLAKGIIKHGLQNPRQANLHVQTRVMLYSKHTLIKGRSIKVCSDVYVTHSPLNCRIHVSVNLFKEKETLKLLAVHL